MQREVLLADASAVSEPFWFGRAGRRAFGWLHPPPGPSRGVGVALCPSLGHELLCAHRAYRHLAEMLAERGFTVARFDYHGTGDSAGDDGPGQGVDAWLDTIDDAVAVLRDAGCGTVALFGARVGATLAAWAAARRGDVDALALVAPLPSGAAFLRELRAMQRVRDAGADRAPFDGMRDGDEEAIGFVYRRETIDGLGRVDLRALSALPAKRALVVPRDDLVGGESRIAERLRALGASVDVVRAPGYAVLAADDPYVADVPHEMWQAVVAWLERLGAEPGARRVPAVARAKTVAVDGVVESVLHYGPDERLFSVLSEPRARTSDVAVVVANTGANMRVGPSRLGVMLARGVASSGHAVARLDIAGLGDSPAHDDAPENELYASRSIRDVRAAVDALAARGYRRFVAAGLCSGAYLSFHAALADPRIAGAVLMNPLAFEWAPGRKVERVPSRGPASLRAMRYYRRRALHLDTWRRALRGDVHVEVLARALAARASLRVKGAWMRVASRFGRGEWLMSDLARQFAALARRGTRVLLLFQDEEPMLDEVEARLGGAAGWLRERGLELVLVPHGDHVFAPAASRARAVEAVTDFVARVAREGR